MRNPLSKAYQKFGGDPDSSIPWIIWLLENPDSPISLGGAIDLRRHDYLHILFKRGTSLEDEAFIIGVTMGNDAKTNFFHYLVFKWASRYLYPKKYRFEKEHFADFDKGVKIGSSLKVKNLNQLDFSYMDEVNVEALRKLFGIEL